MPREIHQPGHNHELIESAVRAGIIKPNDRFTVTDRQDPDQEAMDMVMDRLFDRPCFNWFDMFTPLRIHQCEKDEFHVSTFCGGAGAAMRIDPLFEFIRGPQPKRLRLEGEAPLPVRWLAWLLNNHAAHGSPGHMWNFWMEDWYNPGAYDEGGDDWHELEDEPEKVAKAAAEKRYKEFKKNHPYFFHGPDKPTPKNSKLIEVLKDKPAKRSVEAQTDEALAAIKKRDPKLADILHRMYTYRKETKHFEVGEPLYLCYWSAGTDLNHCIKYIDWNLHQGNIQVDDPFFSSVFKMDNANEVIADLVNFLTPAAELHDYAWKLCRK